MAQTRQQQVDKDERARLANDPKALKAYERSLEKKKEAKDSILASIEKEEKRYEMESFYSYVSTTIAWKPMLPFFLTRLL